MCLGLSNHHGLAHLPLFPLCSVCIHLVSIFTFSLNSSTGYFLLDPSHSSLFSRRPRNITAHGVFLHLLCIGLLSPQGLRHPQWWVMDRIYTNQWMNEQGFQQMLLHCWQSINNLFFVSMFPVLYWCMHWQCLAKRLTASSQFSWSLLHTGYAWGTLVHILTHAVFSFCVCNQSWVF